MYAETLIALLFSVPSSPNFTLSPVAGSPTVFSANWSAPIPKNGIITGYTVYCNSSASQAYPEKVIGPNIPSIRSVANGTTLALTFSTGLNPYTQYSCYVTANTSAGEGSPSAVMTAQTVEDGEADSSIINIICITSFVVVCGMVKFIILCDKGITNQCDMEYTTN